MTNEERDKAIRILQWLHDNKFLFRSTEEDVKYATKLAIQELEQEPKTESKYCDRNICLRNEYNGIGCDECEVIKSQEPSDDLISRQAVLDLVADYDLSMGQVVRGIHALPSVKPQEPKTVLYSGDGYADGYMVYDMAECPNCGYEYEDGDKDWGLSFCPNCGQKLDWESEK